MVFSAAVLSLAMSLQADPSGLVRSYLEKERTARNIQGIAYAVVRNGEPQTVGALGLANVEWQVPATADTVFEIGSISKQFTAALIMSLKEERKLSLSDPVSKHLPESPGAWRSIQIRHLLTHTSGLKNLNAIPGFELTEKLDRKKFIARLGEPPVESAPGAKYAYTNTNYALLGFIVESITGKSYWDNLKERIFTPLGMTNSGDRNPLAVLPRRAAGYDFVGGKTVNRDYDLTDVFAAGAIVSTIEDMVKWERFLHQASTGQAPNGSSIGTAPISKPPLGRASLVEMWTPNKLVGGEATTYGLGFRIDRVKDRLIVGHGGSTSGFSSTIQRWPQHGLTVIVLTNAETLGVATELARGVADLLLEGKR